MFEHGFPKGWSTLKKLIWLIGSGIAGAAAAVYETATGAIASFVTKRSAPLRSLVCAINPVQSGAGDPSPDNIRPISGHTGVDVYRTGDNLFDFDSSTFTANNLIYGGSGSTPDGTLILPVGTYTLSANEAMSGWYIYDSSGRIGLRYNSTTYTFTISKKSAVVIVVYKSGASSKSSFAEYDIQLNIGSTAPTSYHPYTGTTISVSWQTETGTVYGCTLDVVSGVLTVDFSKFLVSDKTWTYDSQYTRFYTDVPDVVIDTSAERKVKTYCSAYQPIYDGRAISNVPNNSIYFGNTGLNTDIYIKTDQYTDPTAFVNAMGNTEILYPLQTPLTFQLTPQEVLALQGQNNIWHDANGDTTVEYRSN